MQCRFLSMIHLTIVATKHKMIVVVMAFQSCTILSVQRFVIWQVFKLMDLLLCCTSSNTPPPAACVVLTQSCFSIWSITSFDNHHLDTSFNRYGLRGVKTPWTCISVLAVFIHFPCSYFCQLLRRFEHLAAWANFSHIFITAKPTFTLHVKNIQIFIQITAKQRRENKN